MPDMMICPAYVSIPFPWCVVRSTGSEVWLSLFQCLLCQLLWILGKLLVLSVSQTHHLEYWENRNTGDSRDVGSMPGSGRSPAEGNGNLLQYSSLENSMDRGAWWVTVHGVAKSQIWLIMHTHDMTCQRPFLKLNWDIKCKGLRIIHGPSVSFQ